MADLFAFLMPVESSTYSQQVDIFAIAFSALILAMAGPVFILIIVFAIKYRRGKPANRVHPPKRDLRLELSWSILPSLCLLGFFGWSTALFATRYFPPANALDIDVVAKQWMWKFQHPEGQGEINELHVPVDQPVKLTMASQDVIHSLFVPALRLKQDVVPGRYTVMWFTPDKVGTFRLTCAEFCGTDHSEMGGQIIVTTHAQYSRWLSRFSVDQTLAAAGAALFRSHGCSGCHDPSASVHAPKLDGVYGSPVPLSDGTTVKADDQYIRDSILLPQKQLAAGYPPIMPTFQNILSEEEVLKLVAYIKSIGTGGAADATQ
ncbi:cytochrome c oxidase, subunit II (plasmid) [Rhizobium leguminosarum bv. trifolii WSM1325]|uniref:cytochrome-c oxidase n=1 Tax=Rhizobium leguminosarum bv. trifolii (strain WSM1325) TaxID=395491 RepID=C6B8H8_RHILS|nr:cytochrome c oxidase subunit II [Rhizobium leguminosarum]ACS60710.1 cytochrome c oxidase, subunit II [Rhizobium leguminosarum bv. trifolii WSM1325]